jgi:hypothetical protein
MSRLTVPLLDRTLYATGDLLLRAEIDLLLKDSSGNWQQARFLVDSGTEMTSMPAAVAKLLGLPMPQHAVPNVLHSQAGVEFRSGVLRVKVVGMDATEYVFPCFFLGDPNATTAPNPASPASRNLLGLSGVINQLRISFDGDPGPGAAFGYLIVEKK